MAGEQAKGDNGTTAVLELVSQGLSQNPQRIELGAKTRIVLGRAWTSDVVLNVANTGPDAEGPPSANIISRSHAEICFIVDEQQRRRWFVKDLNSVNGVFVNDIKVHSNELFDGDIVQLGGAAMMPVGARFFGNRAAIQYRFSTIAAPPPPAPSPLPPPANGAKRKRAPMSGSQSPEVTGHSSLHELSASRRKTSHSSSDGLPWEPVGAKEADTGDDGAPGSTEPLPQATPAVTQQSEAQQRAREQQLAMELAAKTAEVAQLQALVAEADARARSAQTAQQNAEAAFTMMKLAGDRASPPPPKQPQLRDAQVQTAVCDSAAAAAAAAAAEAAAAALKHRLASQLLAEVACCLCEETLLDAALLPCSHAVCGACWTAHCDAHSTACPVCTRKFHSAERRARRSMHLDNVIALLVAELGGAEAQRRMEERAQAAHDAAAAAPKRVAAARTSSGGSGGGPTSPAGGAGGSRISPPGSSGRGADAGKLSPVGSGRKSLSQQQQRLLPVAPLNAFTRKRAALARSAGAGGDSQPREAVCEGCNEPGHDMSCCPHRSDDAFKESDEESDSAVATQ
ncbi:hypothetical protein JKP88DRAFT_334765 [Tribonema minus]|uniref:Uncharacterized protein n=1 Tax=Tribonema minus TaxID=303371 RepID=A0A836C894_9STRA|nr:hypothetical protein JKP88DRAFT_334765 [Tribonema minus]